MLQDGEDRMDDWSADYDEELDRRPAISTRKPITQNIFITDLVKDCWHIIFSYLQIETLIIRRTCKKLFALVNLFYEEILKINYHMYTLWLYTNSRIYKTPQQLMQSTHLAISPSKFTSTRNINLITNLNTHISPLRELLSQHSVLCTIPKYVVHMPNLHELYIENNKIQHFHVPEQLIDKITIIHIQNNPLKVFPGDLLVMTRLTELFIYDTNIAIIPAGISILQNLRYLNIGSNPIEGFPREFRSLTSLISLSIENIQTNTIYLGDLPLLNLQTLYFTHKKNMYLETKDSQGIYANISPDLILRYDDYHRKFIDFIRHFVYNVYCNDQSYLSNLDASFPLSKHMNALRSQIYSDPYEKILKCYNEILYPTRVIIQDETTIKYKLPDYVFITE